MKQEKKPTFPGLCHVKTTGELLSHGKIFEALKEYSKIWKLLFMTLKPLLVSILIFSLLGWIYINLYNKLGIDRVIISGVVILTYYLSKIHSKLEEISKWN